jgi:hypothetical protein
VVCPKCGYTENFGLVITDKSIYEAIENNGLITAGEIVSGRVKKTILCMSCLEKFPFPKMKPPLEE